MCCCLHPPPDWSFRPSQSTDASKEHCIKQLEAESSLSRVQQTNKHQKAVTRYQEGSSSASYTGTTEHNRQVQAVSRPLLHRGVLVVYGDPLACWPSQAGLLLQSAVLFMVQLLQLSSASLLTHLHTAPSSNALNSRKQDTQTQTHTLTQHHQASKQATQTHQHITDNQCDSTNKQDRRTEAKDAAQVMTESGAAFPATG